MPEKFPAEGIETFTSIEEGLKGCDVVMMLRNQKERMQAGQIPDDTTYFRDYGLSRARLELCAKDVIVMHPGPMNRGAEIADDIPDDPHVSVITKQVTNGIYTRMAVLTWLLAS
jgi:aspartate carbamoyltransferase catalytic subunit